MKIVFTGGGTAGHIFPILAIVREIKRVRPADPNLRLFFIGPKDENDKYILNLLVQEGVKVKKIIAGKLRRYFSLMNFLDLFKIPVGFFQALFWFFFSAPDLIFSKGGYGSFPAVLAARLLNIPIFLHESDVVPGLTSRITSRWALEIFTSFQKTEYFPKEKIIAVGNPIRSEILNGSKEEAAKIFGLKHDKPLILILGGSQGAQSINELVLEILPELLAEFEVVHQTGRKNYREVEAEANVLLSEVLRTYYHPVAFLDEIQLKHIFAGAQIVVSRAGSGALFEIAAVGKPAILIPLPKAAQNHQVKNAYQFSEEGVGEVLEEENLKPHFFLEKLKYFFSRPGLLQAAAEGATWLARPKAARLIANYLLDYLLQSTGGTL